MHCHKMLLETAIHFSCNETEYTLYIGAKLHFQSFLCIFFSSRSIETVSQNQRTELNNVKEIYLSSIKKKISHFSHSQNCQHSLRWTSWAKSYLLQMDGVWSFWPICISVYLSIEGLLQHFKAWVQLPRDITEWIWIIAITSKEVRCHQAIKWAQYYSSFIIFKYDFRSSDYLHSYKCLSLTPWLEVYLQNVNNIRIPRKWSFHIRESSSD